MTIQPLNATVATPAAYGFAYLLDSTRWGQSIAGTLQPSTSLSSPGTDRDWMTDRWVQGGIQPIGQAVTLLCYTLSPAGAWVHQAALDQTCPAGQVTAFSFAPDTYGAVDGMVAVQAGAVPPTSIGGLGTVSDSAATAAQLAALANLMPTNSNAAVAIAGGTVGGSIVSESAGSWVGGTPPAAGSIVRLVSAGVYTTAQADTAAHAANIQGIWNGTKIIPLVGFNNSVLFDGAVTLGPCYLSPTIAGALTTTTPSLAYVNVPCGVAYYDLTVAAAYAAKVSNLISQTSALSLKDALLQDVCASLGGVPKDWYHQFDDMDYLPYGASYPTWGYTAAGAGYAAPTTISRVRLGVNAIWEVYTGGGIYPTPANPCLWPFRLSIKVSHTAGTNAGTYFNFLGTSGLLGYGVHNGGAADPSKLYFWNSRTWQLPAGGNPAAGDIVLAGTNDGAEHIAELQSAGAGYCSFRFDYGAWTTPAQIVSATSDFQLVALRTYDAGNSSIDWVSWVVKRY